MNVLSSDDYYSELMADIPRAKQRVTLAAMAVLANGKLATLFDALEAAAKRGVQVTVLRDVYTRLGIARDGGISRAAHKQQVADTDKRLAKLKKLGATIIEVGAIGFNPVKGRMHAKITIIDDRWYCFGGVNLTNGSLSQTDIMCAGTNKALADDLQALVLQIGKYPVQEDLRQPVDDSHILLFDGGSPGQSIIYDRAVALTSQSKRVYYVSQMVPTGRLAAELRRVRSECYFDRPSQGRGVFAASLFVDSLLSRLPNRYKRSAFLHAKFMLFELTDGSQVLLTGSHNFAWRGVLYGTKEIALESTDEHLWQQLYQFMQQHVV